MLKFVVVDSDRSEVARLLEEALGEAEDETARSLAKKLRVDRSLINSVLYEREDLFKSFGDAPPVWRLASASVGDFAREAAAPVPHAPADFEVTPLATSLGRLAANSLGEDERGSLEARGTARRKGFRHEIDVHGFTVDTAMRWIRASIQEAWTSGCSRLVVIHGKGRQAGGSAIAQALRKAVDRGEFGPWVSKWLEDVEGRTALEMLANESPNRNARWPTRPPSEFSD